MRKLFIILVSLIALSLVACDQNKQPSALRQDQATVGDQQAIYSKSLPVPVFDYSQTRSSLIQILQAKTAAVSTYSVIASMTGQPVYVCPSIGFPIPADTQLTNPLRADRLTGEDGGIAVVEQPEPDGTYTSQNTDATYVLCVRANGDVAVVYSEQKVTTFTFPVKLENGAIVDAGGASTVVIEVRGK